MLRNPHLAEAQLSGLGLDLVCNVLACGCSCGLYIARYTGCMNKGLVKPVVLPMYLSHIWVGVTNTQVPIDGSSLPDDESFQGILTGVELRHPHD